MDIAPVHTVLSEVVTSVVADRDILTDGDGIEILSLQEHVVAVDTDGVTLVVRSSVSTHDTVVTSIGVRHSELRAVSTTGQRHRMVRLQGVLVLESLPPVSTFPTVLNLIEDVSGHITCPIHLHTRSVEGILINDGHVLLSIEELRTLVGVRPTESAVVAELNLTSLTLLGSHQDHTVSSTGTVDGSRSSVLQNIDSLDISGVDVIKASTCYTVDYVKRCRVTGSTDTTDVNLVTLTRLC